MSRSSLRGYSRLGFTGSPFAGLRRRLLRAHSLSHNGAPVLEYPESDWDIVAFPAQKGGPYVADNLATVNDHSFLHESRFATAYAAASSRWSGEGRDIRWRLHTFLWAMETSLRLHPRGGALVELGTGNGFMAAGACAYLDWGAGALTAGRELWLFDSFRTIRRDEIGQNVGARFFYADGDVDVRAYFSRWRDVHIVTGWLPEAIAELPPGPVCFVHVDLNHAESEIGSLEKLQSALVPGAIVLFDDSGNPGCAEQRDAHQAWARSVSAPLLQLPSGQALCIVR